MSRTLADLDASRAKAFAKGGGTATPLTVAEQLLREKAEGALDRLEKARRTGDPIAIARAKLSAERVQAELQMSTAARGSLTQMRSALAGAMTRVTVS
jgi:hypothetical protein